MTISKHTAYTFLLFAFLLFTFSSCRKTDYPTVAQAAYIRVFNDLQFHLTLDNKDAPQPFLVFLMDPQLDENGIPVGAATTGDFLDQRDPWARPYPDAGNTSIWQKEYPGANKVIAAPILNGFDLSPWAQVPGGKHRIMILTRPKNTTPFFSILPSLRNNVLVDTTIELKTGEVYTMHILEQDAFTKKTGLYVREEQFWKQPFSDSLVYVNFYNLSADGFFRQTLQDPQSALYITPIKDSMQVFYTLFRSDPNSSSPGVLGLPVSGHTDVFMARIVRSQEPVVQPYHSFPLFPDTSSNRVYIGYMQQKFTFLPPGFTPAANPYAYDNSTPRGGNYTVLYCGKEYDDFDYGFFNVIADLRTGLVISVHSGRDNPRSFATVNTVEYVNGQMYVTSIQRRYDPPIYY